jgi:hypothetical protein
MTEEQRQLAMDFQSTFDTPHGKRTLAAIRSFSGFDDRILPTGNSDFAIFDLGKRELFLYILDKVNADTSEPEQQVAAQTDDGHNVQGRRQEVAVGD